MTLINTKQTRLGVSKIAMDFLMEESHNYIIDKMQKTLKKIDLEITYN